MSEQPTLVRALGRWSLVALVINGVVGTGVFFLPGSVGGALGWNAVWAWSIAALATGAVAVCFAEVASRFDAAGGPYLYAQAAFGRFVGIQMAWMTYLARCISAAVQANLFTTYLGEFWPWAKTGTGAVAVTTAVLALHALVNTWSVGSGARASSGFVLVKIASLLLIGVAGLVWLGLGRELESMVVSDAGWGTWLDMVLSLMFAFGGFESALIPLAEAKDPRRDAPFAILFGLGLVTALYLSVQVAVLATVRDPGATQVPVADAARVIAGTTGATVMTLAALVSVYGWLASNMLNVPRLTMAMSHRGDLPGFFGRVHPRFRTPWVSILLFAGVAWALAVQAGLRQNLSLAAVSRLVPYAVIAAALLAFRRREARGVVPAGCGPALFRPRAGPLLAVIGMIVAVVLVARMNEREAIGLSVTAAIATAHWTWLRNKRTA